MDLTDRIGCVLTPAGGLLPGLGPACDGRVGRRAGRAGVGCRPRRHRASPEAGCGRLLERDGARRGARAALPVPDHHRRGRGPGTARRGGARRAQLRAHPAGDGRNASLVPDRGPYTWAPFDPPRFENFLVYQFHVGTFAGRGDEHGIGWATFEQVESKLGYIKELGFTCVEPLPVQEYAMDRSWGYNPATWFAPESSYGSPAQLRHFVDAAHRAGLAVIFDVVYNHFGDSDNVLWDYDGYTHEGGIYREGGQDTCGASARRGGSARSATTSTRTPACTWRSTGPTGSGST